jgi:hypothetical protein
MKPSRKESNLHEELILECEEHNPHIHENVHWLEQIMVASQERIHHHEEQTSVDEEPKPSTWETTILTN